MDLPSKSAWATRRPASSPSATSAPTRNTGQPVVEEIREPVVDLFEEKDHLLIVAEMPGISAADVQLEVKDDVLTIMAAKGDKKYRKEVLLPGSYPKENAPVLQQRRRWKSSASNRQRILQPMDKTQSVQLKLKVTEAIGKDVGRALARIGPEDLERLQVAIGDTVEVGGKRATVCKVMPAYKELRGQSRVQLDGLTRENAGAALDEFVQVRKIAVRPAQRIGLAPLTIAPDARDLQYIGSLLDGLPVQEGDRIRAVLFGSRCADFKVESTTPGGPVLINPTTELAVGKAEVKERARDGGALRRHRRPQAPTAPHPGND